MSDKEKEQIEWLKTFRNQLMGIFATALCGGLFMTYMFMTSIQGTIKQLDGNFSIKFQAIDDAFEKVDKSFDKTDKRIDKVEDKVDGIYQHSVPEKEQIQEPRKKLPNF